MASLKHEKKHRRFRVSYSIRLPAGPIYRSRYATTRAEADQLRRQLEAVETAARTGLAPVDQIEDWLGRGWLKPEEAMAAFRDWRQSGGGAAPARVDFERIQAAYEEYALSHSKAGSPYRKSHRTHQSLSARVVAWLQAEHPALDLKALDVEAWLRGLRRDYAPWTVYHYGTYLRLLLDRAVELGMLRANVAREVPLPPPRAQAERRSLSTEEAQLVLGASLKPEYASRISGCLPTVVRLGLYAGLRNEEMAQARWEWLDSKRRILTVRAVGSEEGEEAWSPKDDDQARRLDVKEGLVEWLGAERVRQQRAGLLGPYMVVAGHEKQPQYRGRPIGSEALTHAFAVLVAGEGLPGDLTLYCLRHTYASALLRAGVDVKTVQARLGHSDLKTTMGYLHAIEAEAHPTDALPY